MIQTILDRNVDIEISVTAKRITLAAGAGQRIVLPLYHTTEIDDVISQLRAGLRLVVGARTPDQPVQGARPAAMVAQTRFDQPGRAVSAEGAD